MKFLSFARKNEGESIPAAWFSIGRTLDSNGQGVYATVCMPVPVFQRFEGFDTCAICEGWRVLRFGLRVRRNNQGKWFAHCGAWMHALTNTVIATREQIEDGALDAETLRIARKAIGRY